MIIENNKNGTRHAITEKDWQKLKDLGTAKSFKVIRREDTFIPKEIVSLKKFKTK